VQPCIRDPAGSDSLDRVADWVTISALATAGGTLALAAATYGSVRSANRSAVVAELALQEQRRPVLVHSRNDDRTQTVSFAGGYSMSIAGGGAAVDAGGEGVYLAASLRNVGAGIAVLQGWQGDAVADADPASERRWRQSLVEASPPGVEDFRRLARDQYIASGDTGIWQGAVRDPADPLFATIAAAAAEQLPLQVDLLYTDQVGGQRTISRFALMPGDDGWIIASARHWYLDAPAPR
jgi:hypothetical protein